MIDPAGYLANLGSDLTLEVLKALRRRAEEFVQGTPKYQALKRCYGAAEAVLLPPGDPLFETYHPLLQAFLAEPQVAAELAKLVKGRSPDVPQLVELFTDVSHGRGLPPIDIEARLAAAIEAFLQMAEAEEALQGAIRTAQLRRHTDLLEKLPERLAEAITPLVQGIRTGDVAFMRDATVHGDIITGVKIQVNPPPPAPPDPCLELGERYLRALINDLVALPLAALDDEGADSRRSSLTLDQVYIDLNTEREVDLSRAEKKEPDLRYRDKRPLTALEAAARTDRLVLLGDPGSGKSVFVNHLASLHGRAHLNHTPLPAPLAGPPRWPVRYILRELAASLSGQLDPGEFDRLTPRQQDRQLLAAARSHLLEQFTTFNLAPAEAEPWSTCLSRRPGLTILDGLDEVPLVQLPWVRRLIQLLAHGIEDPVIVTCRVRSYEAMPALAGFATETLASFTPEQRTNFIAAWYQAQTGLTDSIRQERITSLREAVGGLPVDLTSNPLLLTTLALIHTAGTELPKQRAVLYSRGVEVLMRRWQRHKHGQASLLEQLDLESNRLLEGLRALAFEAQQAAQPGQIADLDEDRAVGLLARLALGSRQKAEQFLAYVDRQAGLLVGRGGGETAPPVYRFAHRTFQEYLAGCHLAGQREGLARAIKARLAEGERWYLVAQLAAEHLLYNTVQPYPVLDLLYTLCPVASPAHEADWRGLAWAGVIAAEMGPDRIAADDAPDGGRRFLSRLTPRLQSIVEQGMLTVAERADAGDALARLDGDDRPGVGLIVPGLEGEAAVPNHQLCYIPPGPFWLGSRKVEDDLAYDDEHGHDRPVDLAYPYWLARYPVTQIQYQAFVQATTHSLQMVAEDWAQPYIWRNGLPPPQRRSHPVVLVSWHDAMAYCDWLNGQLADRLPEGYSVRLPTDAEWEKAARGGLDIPARPHLSDIRGEFSPVSTEALQMQANPAPNRRWPWGEWAAESPLRHANVADSRRLQTMAVGSFPDGASPYGCLDMSGNVWEWTLSKFRPYPYRDDDRNSPEGDENRALRGGGWYDYRRNARVSARFHVVPDYFDI
jgi:formylglycine-generating enzyme required for sulfatase activity